MGGGVKGGIGKPQKGCHTSCDIRSPRRTSRNCTKQLSPVASPEATVNGTAMNHDGDASKIPYSPDERSPILVSSDGNDLRTLVVQLLGRGRITTYARQGALSASLDDVADLQRRIVQRVEGQNQGKLVDFVTVIQYGDHSTDEIPSLEDFESYRSFSSYRCTSIEMRFAFLIRFSRSDYQNQSINITFSSPDYDSSDNWIEESLKGSTPTGSASISIEYTDVTWANDIKHLFKQYVEDKFDRSAFIDRISNLFIGNAHSIIGFSVLLFSFAAMMSHMRISSQNVIQGYSSIVDTNAILRFEKKLDYWITNRDSNFPLYFLVSMLIFPLVVATRRLLISFLTKHLSRRSYLIVSGQNRKQNDDENRARNLKLVGTVVAVIVSILASIAAARLDVLIFG